MTETTPETVAANEHRYVIVLAGGEGTRLAPLTRALYGRDLPKQFAQLVGDQSLLQQTIERARTLATLDHIVVIVTGQHEICARTQLARFPGVDLVVQPRNLGTAAGVLLPLVRIRARTSNAHVVVLPSDHYYSNVAPIDEALYRTELDPLRDRLALIGVPATGPEADYGWIVPGERIGSADAFAITRFVEKPTPLIANKLWRDGGLWNTFILAGGLSVYWDLARRHLPRHAATLERYAATIGGARENEALADAYRELTPANFSCDILVHARSLAVLPVHDTGWSDWGSPGRVFASLAGTPSHDLLVERIQGDVVLAACGS